MSSIYILGEKSHTQSTPLYQQICQLNPKLSCSVVLVFLCYKALLCSPVCSRVRPPSPERWAVQHCTCIALFTDLGVVVAGKTHSFPPKWLSFRQMLKQETLHFVVSE